MADPLHRTLGEQPRRRPADALEHRQAGPAGAELLAPQQAPIVTAAIATPSRANWSLYHCGPHVGQANASASTRRSVCTGTRRRAAAPRGLPLRMDSIRAVLLQPPPQPVEQRPRQPMPSARRTHIAHLRRVAQHAQTLTVYAVLEGHRSRPFHVSPPRETRGRIGRVALVSSGGRTTESVNTIAEPHRLESRQQVLLAELPRQVPVWLLAIGDTHRRRIVGQRLGRIVLGDASSSTASVTSEA